MIGINRINPTDVQELLDEGKGAVSIQRELGIYHHSYVSRVIKRHNLENYTAFDEYDYKYDPSSTINFEWTWEEDQLEEMVNRIVDNGEFNLSKNNMDLSGVSKYIKNNYGDILTYFIRKRYWFLVDYLKIECRVCGGMKPVYEFYKNRSNYGYFGFYTECKECTKSKGRLWVKENPQRFKELVRNLRDRYPDRYSRYSRETLAKRRAIDYHLGYDFTVDSNEKIFGKTCVMTGETDIAYDHFIPLIWRHGGSYNRNMYPLIRRLNSSKWSHNPFKWFDENRERFNLDPDKFNALVSKLAELNELTTEEYVNFVNWCDSNRRTEEEMEQSDGRPSIELWREVTAS